MPSERSGSLDADGLEALLGLLLDPSPATQVRIVLREYRRLGWGFEQAWAQAMRTLPRKTPDAAEWRALFHRQKPIWADSYSGFEAAQQVELVL